MQLINSAVANSFPDTSFKISGQGVDLRTAPYKESLITSIRTAILSQDEFDKIIDWQSIKRADGSARFVSSIDAWAEFNRLIRDYTWVVPHFSPRIDWFKHEQDAINMVSTSGMLSEIDDSHSTVRGWFSFMVVSEGKILVISIFTGPSPSSEISHSLLLSLHSFPAPHSTQKHVSNSSSPLISGSLGGVHDNVGL